MAADAPKKSAKKAVKKTEKQTTKQTSKKSTKVAVKATAKQTQKVAPKKAVKKVAPKNTQKAEIPAPAVAGVDLTAAAKLAAKVDISSLSEKTRVHAIAKMIGLASKDLVAVLAQQGLSKTAQASMSPAEVKDTFVFISGEKAEAKTGAKVKTEAKAKDKTESKSKAEAEAPAAAHAPDVDEEKLRERVRKNVVNEISQIQAKVESELAESEAAASDADDSIADDAPAHGLDLLQEALNHVVEDEEDDEEEDFPLVTPMPDDDDYDAYEFAPIFMPPQPKKAVKAEEVEQEPEVLQKPKGIRGSTRIEAQRRRRAELREQDKGRRHLVSQAEFLARRESVERTMIVRDKQRKDGRGTVTQVAVLEDDLLVEHFVTSQAQTSHIGNIYLGRVQNVLPSMEAAFIDIGQGRNGVLYAGEVDWRQAGLGGRSRKIEHALKSGDMVLVQVAKDPIGHKGARLTTQISLAGRYLVYVPNGRSAGISRKLPVPERKRLKEILERVVPDNGGAIIRTAAENVPEGSIARDVNRLHNLWLEISAQAEKNKHNKSPMALYEEPDLLIKVVRDLFNEDFNKLIVDGKRSYNTVNHYVQSVAPDLAERVQKYDSREHGGLDAFAVHRVDEQLHKALSRKVWLPSGGTLVIDRTEAMTVVDVNTGKFTGSGGNLEETVTRNNLEAAEEIVRQMRLRDLGGMIVVDFIDMVLPENQELVLRRLKEALGRDRTRHQVSEVTSLGLVQMTRKRLGTGLIETFSTECTCCNGRGLIIHEYPVDEGAEDTSRDSFESRKPKDSSIKRRKAQPAVPAVQPKASDAELEYLAAAVVGREEGKEEDEPAGENRSRRRRGSRGNSRGKAQAANSRQDVAQQDAVSELSEIEAIAYAAAENAKQLDDVEEFNSYVPEDSLATEVVEPTAEKTFEQAKAEFEASPRRRRRTRGNSRSDIAPQKSDFVTPEAASAPKLEPKAESKTEPKPESKRSTRTRRRVTRKGSTDSAAATPSVQAPVKEKTPVVEVKTSSRGRRRVARRSTT